jgi:hypothetical protein
MLVVEARERTWWLPRDVVAADRLLDGSAVATLALSPLLGRFGSRSDSMSAGAHGQLEIQVYDVLQPQRRAQKDKLDWTSSKAKFQEAYHRREGSFPVSWLSEDTLSRARIFWVGGC